MTERAEQLHATADRQIAELIALISTLDEGALRRPCPGREKLGDGTIAAAARHTADNYQRIAGFVQTSDHMSAGHQPQGASHRMPRFLRALGHGPQDHAEHGPGASRHADQYTADTTDPGAVVEALTAARDALGRIAKLTDSQLDQVPRRTLSGSATGSAPSSRSSRRCSSIKPTSSTHSARLSPERWPGATLVANRPWVVPRTRLAGLDGHRGALRVLPSGSCAPDSR